MILIYLHKPAKSIFAECHQANAHFLTTELIFVEFLNSLSAVKYRHQATILVDKLRVSQQITVIQIDSFTFDTAYELYRTRLDKGWSLTDCASFIVMKDRQIDLAFTSDKHFEQAGFKKLLGK